MGRIRIYDFITGVETSTPPDSAAPVNPSDIVPLSYLQTNYAAKSGTELSTTLTLTDQSSSPAAPAAGKTRIYTKLDGKLYKKTNADVEVEVGSGVGGGGGGGINYISNPDAEADAVGWETYADATQATPVDGTGGVVNITWERNATSPLRGDGDFLFSKDAADRQGEGVATDFTIDAADKSKRLSISFDWKTSANYSSGDIGIYIYDKDANVLINPSVVNLPATSGSATRVQVYFNATTSDDYRLIFHVQSTNASAYTCQADQFEVGPEDSVQTTPISDWKNFTGSESFSGISGFTNRYFYWRRQGDTLQVKGSYTPISPNGDTWFMLVPFGLHINSSAISGNSNGTSVGEGWRYSSAETVHSFYDGSSTTQIFFCRNGITKVAGNAAINNGEWIYLEFEVPIAEWAGSSVGLTNSRVEYAYNSSTATAADDTTSFAYGPSGAQIQNITTNVERTVRFQNPIQSTDQIKVQVSSDRVVWHDLTSPIMPNGYGFDLAPFEYQLNKTYGMGRLRLVTGSVTDVIVTFGIYSAPDRGGAWGDNGQAWSSGAGSWYWRVVKSSNPISIGYENLGVTDGSYAAEGQIGEYKTASGSYAIGQAATWLTALTLNLPAGCWQISGELNGTSGFNGDEFYTGLAIDEGSGAPARYFALYTELTRVLAPFVPVVYSKSSSFNVDIRVSNQGGARGGVDARIFAVRIR